MACSRDTLLPPFSTTAEEEPAELGVTVAGSPLFSRKIDRLLLFDTPLPLFFLNIVATAARRCIGCATRSIVHTTADECSSKRTHSRNEPAASNGRLDFGGFGGSIFTTTIPGGLSSFRCTLVRCNCFFGLFLLDLIFIIIISRRRRRYWLHKGRLQYGQ